MLTAATTTALLLAAAQPVLAFVLALLAASQLAQLLHQFVDLGLGLFRFTPLHRLVLIAQLVELQFEEVGKVLRELLVASPTTAAAALLE